MKVPEVKQLKLFEEEKARLRKLHAQAMFYKLERYLF